MPIPPNTSFATAIDIGTTLPYSLTGIDPTDSGNAYTLYYKRVVQVGEEGRIMGCLAYRGTGTAVLPNIKIYTAVATPYLSAISLSNKRLQFPLPAAGTTIYFEINLNDILASSFTYDFSVYLFTEQAIPDRSFIINSDEAGYPATILAPVTAEVLSFQTQIIPGEGGDILPNGKFLLSPLSGNDCKIYNPDLTLNTTVTIAGIFIAGSGNQLDKFYVLTIETGRFYIRSVTSGGVVGSAIGPLNTNLTANGAMLAVSRDETIAYITNGKGTGTDRGVIYRWDLVNNLPLSNLANLVTGGTQPPGLPSGTYYLAQVLSGVSPGTILVLANGNIAVLYWRSNEADGFVRVYDPSGTVISNKIYPTSQNFLPDRLAHDPEDDNTFWIWVKEGGLAATFGFGKFQHINSADGSVIEETTTRPEVENGGALRTAVTATTDEFGFPFCCPFLILRAAITPPDTGGTIIVTKQTNPIGDSQEFTLTATNLIPTSFNLSDGDSQEFTDLVPGSGYGIDEIPVAGYATSYSISNGSPRDNISVGDGETVTVIVINTKISESGIYKIVPESNKTNETLWVDGFEETVNVKIPDPTYRTGPLP